MSGVDFAVVLAAHEGCRMNDTRDGHYDSSADTGVDVWTCEIRTQFEESIEGAERAHLAAALDKAVDVWLGTAATAAAAHSPHDIESGFACSCGNWAGSTLDTFTNHTGPATL